MPRPPALLAAVLALLLVPAAAEAKRQVPHGFLGVMADGPLPDGPANLEHETRVMANNGVEGMRVAFYWARAQPYAGWDDVPEGERERFTDVRGVPTDFTQTDRIVRAAARNRLDLLPVVLVAPGWAAEKPGDFGSPPRSPEPYAAYVRALVERYGPRGALWSTPGPRRSVRRWQIWNEPNIPWFWNTEGRFEFGYVALLRAAARSVRAVDPRAQVYLAGMTNGARLNSWQALERVYRAGGRGHFDVAAAHPYTARPSNLVRTAERLRRVAVRFRDPRRPIALTEISWSSSNGRAAERYATWDTSERMQAVRLRDALRLLIRERRRLRLVRVDWYSWVSPAEPRRTWMDYAGLRKVRGDGRLASKPALRAFRGVARPAQGRRP